MAEVRSEHSSQLKGSPSRVDPNVFIPPAVRAAAERAEQLQRESGVANMPEPAPQDAPQEPVPSPQPEPAPAPQPQPRPDQPPVEPPTGAPRAAQETPQDDEGTLQERYTREHHRSIAQAKLLDKARHDNDALSRRITDLEGMLATIQVANYEAAPSRERTFTSSLTDKEREEWGEVLPVIEKQAKDLIAPLEAELQDKIKQIDEQLKSIGTATAVRTKGEFLSALDMSPQIGLGAGENCWRVLNDDTADGGFVHWLQGYDRRSGRRMHEMLKEAYSRNDAPVFAAFFEDFLREQGRLAPPPKSNGAAAAPGQNNGSAPAPAQGLERFAAPGKPKHAATAPTVPAEPETFTSGDISRFYQDKQLGRWNGREAEMDAYEQRMHAAVRENRVKPGLPQP